MSEKGTRVEGGSLSLYEYFPHLNQTAEHFVVKIGNKCFFALSAMTGGMRGGLCDDKIFPFFGFCTHAMRNGEKWSRIWGALYSYTYSVCKRKFEWYGSRGL